VTEPPPLTTTSFLVLGLVGAMEPVTPYDMKRRVARSIGYFWSFPHSQLYAEPARLAELGLLEERIEAGGRRRKTYLLTDEGRRELQRWLGDPAVEPAELRDHGLLKLFFADQAGPGERAALATEQHRSHRQRQAEYEALYAEVRELATASELATLEMGLAYERAAVAFWAELVSAAGTGHADDAAHG
jgi:DNA-binding PadR family transcriptional regulator